MTRDDLWFITLTADWGWLRRLIFVASWPLFCLWARLRMKWWAMWRREALRWEGVARDFAERLEAIGDTDWLNDYRTSRDDNWWECWDD